MRCRLRLSGVRVDARLGAVRGSRSPHRFLERPARVELALPAWKAVTRLWVSRVLVSAGRTLLRLSLPGSWRPATLEPNRTSGTPCGHLYGRSRVSAFHAAALASIVLLITGCASMPPPLPVEVRIPVPVPCAQIVPERPALAWDGLADAGVYDQVRALLIDRGRLVAHVDELQAVLVGCAGQ